jgi:hypothetical protein
MAAMNPRFTQMIICLGICVSAINAAHAETRPRTAVQLRRVILHTQHLGAHGMGYSERSLDELAGQIAPADIPALVDLLADRRLRVGVTFALASQCEPAILPVREAALQHKMDFLEAQEVMDLIASFAACTPEAHQKAMDMRSDLNALRDADQAKIEKEAKQRAENDARVQRNALKMTDPAQATSLSRTEREEVYHRSLKAMGLDENGPLTPQQKNMVDRMYRAMVLGEPSKPSPQ